MRGMVTTLVVVVVGLTLSACGRKHDLTFPGQALTSQLQNATELAAILARVAAVLPEAQVQRIDGNVSLPQANSCRVTVRCNLAKIDHDFHEYTEFALDRALAPGRPDGELAGKYRLVSGPAPTFWKYAWLQEETAEVAVLRSIPRETFAAIIAEMRRRGALSYALGGTVQSIAVATMFREGITITELGGTLVINRRFVYFPVTINGHRCTIHRGTTALV